MDLQTTPPIKKPPKSFFRRKSSSPGSESSSPNSAIPSPNATPEESNNVPKKPLNSLYVEKTAMPDSTTFSPGLGMTPMPPKLFNQSQLASPSSTTSLLNGEIRKERESEEFIATPHQVPQRSKTLIEWPSQNRPPRPVSIPNGVIFPGGKIIRQTRKLPLERNENKPRFFNRKTFNNNTNFNNKYQRMERPQDAQNVAEDADDDWNVSEISEEKLQKTFFQSNVENKQDDDWPDSPETNLKQMGIRETVAPIQNHPKKSCRCTSCDSFTSCATWLETHVDFQFTDNKPAIPLLRSPQDVMKTREINKIFSQEFLLHGVDYRMEVPRIKQKNPFNGKMAQYLSELGVDKGQNMQAYTWPALFRGLHLMVSGGSQVQRIITYMPVICSFLADYEINYPELRKFRGPMVVAVCENDRKCEEVQAAFEKFCGCLNSEITIKLHIDTNLPATKEISCDVLVTTTEALISGLKSSVFTLKRLTHFLLDGADKLLAENPEIYKKLFDVMNKIHLKRPSPRNIQVIAVDAIWSLNLVNLLRIFHSVPLVCFGDYFEAALYSQIVLTRKNMPAKHKVFHMIDLLKVKYSSLKTVIICDEEERPRLEENFLLSGIETTVLTDDLMSAELSDYQDMWSTALSGRYKVLICDDKMFARAERIKNAQLLIHYTLPKDFSIFTKRYRCLAANIMSPIEENQNNKIHHYLITDEANNDNPIIERVYKSSALNKVALFKP